MREQTRIGWWEWVALPGVHGRALKAKCDTGATLSALHAEDLEVVTRGSMRVARFRVTSDSDVVELAVTSTRQIRSSNGESQARPVVLCPIEIGSLVIAIECTLTDRTPMAYPMLLGRSTLAGRFLVDSSASHVLGKPRLRRAA